ncbi:hypothetical protein BsIDN1_72140 [Bacillus safensis]|uniref:Uncharacterized protein n=1 Tax=Bacillus safensis TaxID=561879 RepID=A0A5S9MP82_BACIA|nr:hypothetical protein BsIDN1_72140 [Bacillus safensis]
MKHSLSRFFGLGDKEHPERETEIEAEIAEHDTLKEEIQELPVDTIMPNRFQPRTIFFRRKDTRAGHDDSYPWHYPTDCC